VGSSKFPRIGFYRELCSDTHCCYGREGQKQSGTTVYSLGLGVWRLCDNSGVGMSVSTREEKIAETMMRGTSHLAACCSGKLGHSSVTEWHQHVSALPPFGLLAFSIYRAMRGPWTHATETSQDSCVSKILGMLI